MTHKTINLLHYGSASGVAEIETSRGVVKVTINLPKSSINTSPLDKVKVKFDTGSEHKTVFNADQKEIRVLVGDQIFVVMEANIFAHIAASVWVALEADELKVNQSVNGLAWIDTQQGTQSHRFTSNQVWTATTQAV
ncbi:MAG: hypothetical protein AAF633_24680 [Chloroflexota bacterium]